MKKGLKKSLVVGRLALGLSSSFTLGVPHVFAQSTPAQSTPSSSFVFSSSDGVIIGTGELDGTALELELLAGFSGFAQLLVTDAAGNAVAYDVMIASDGSITVVSDAGFGAMADLPALAGATVEVTYADGIDAVEVSDATGLDRAREVTADNENAQKGLDKAEEAQSDARSKKEAKDSEKADKKGGKADEQDADEQGDEQADEQGDEQGADEQGDEQGADEQGDDESTDGQAADESGSDNADHGGDDGENGGDDGDHGDDDGDHGEEDDG